MLNAIELNKEIYRQIGYLSDDRVYLEKALEMLRGLTIKKICWQTMTQKRQRKSKDMLR